MPLGQIQTSNSVKVSKNAEQGVLAMLNRFPVCLSVSNWYLILCGDIKKAKNDEENEYSICGFAAKKRLLVENSFKTAQACLLLNWLLPLFDQQVWRLV